MLHVDHADRTRSTGPAEDAFLGPDADTSARAEMALGRHHRRSLDSLGQEVRRADAHGKFAHHAGSVDHAIVCQHAQETVVISRAADQAGPAEREARLVEIDRACARIDRHQLLGDDAVVRRQAALLGSRHLEPGAVHPGGFEHVIVQVHVKRLARDDLDHAPKHVQPGRVAPLGAGFVNQRDIGHPVREFLKTIDRLAAHQRRNVELGDLAGDQAAILHQFLDRALLYDRIG